MKKLVRFRILKENFAVGGLSLPKGDYDGEISWSEQPVIGFPTRIRGPLKIFVTPALLQEAGQPVSPRILSIELDAAIKKGELVVL